MINMHIKRFTAYLVPKQMQIKASVRYPNKSLELLKMEKSDKTKCWWGLGATEALRLPVGKQEGRVTLEVSLVDS